MLYIMFIQSGTYPSTSHDYNLCTLESLFWLTFAENFNLIYLVLYTVSVSCNHLSASTCFTMPRSRVQHKRF